jgi:HK97 family phage prohead protease
METKPYPTEHSARLRDPGDFDKDSFRRKNVTKGVDIIIGHLKGEDTMTTQAYRFDAKEFTANEAKAWLKDHDIEYISFEAATGKSTGSFQIKSNYELKDADEKTGIVTGYASIFNNLDSDNEIVMQGAFAKTLVERGPDSAKPRIKHLWQHDSWQPIGIPKVLKEKEKGLYFETLFGNDSFSKDKLQQHIDMIITELSIGYNVVRSEDIRNEETGERESRKLTELKLWEYSSVTWGANSLTEVISAKGENADILANLNKRLEALNRGLKNGKYTDETCEQFEAEIEKIQAIIKSLNINPAPERSTQGIVAPTTKQILETIINVFKS